MKQSFKDIMKVANGFHKEVDQPQCAQPQKRNQNPLFIKYLNRLYFTAAQRGEQWAL